MSSIPLPALNVRPPQQQDTLGQFANLLQLRNQIQNAPLQRQALEQQVQAGQMDLQQRQMDLQARNALNQAFSSAVSKDQSGNMKFDPDKLQSALANGPAAYQTPQVMENLTKWQAAKTSLQNSAADLQAKLADLRGSAAAAIKASNYDPNVAHAMLDSMLSDPSQANSPQAQQMRAMIDNPNTLHQWVDTTIAQSPAQQKMQNEQTVAGIRANNVEMQEMRDWLQKNPGKTPADYQQFKVNQGVQADVAKQTNPDVIRSKEEVAAVEGQARANSYAQTREYQVYDNKTHTPMMLSAAELNVANQKEPGRYTLPGYTPEALGAKGTTNYFTSGAGGKQLTAFNTALQHLDTLNNLASDLNNSNVQVLNKAAQAWAEQTGNPAPANFAAAKNAMAGEVAAALKASGATDTEIAKVDATFSRVQSPMQLKGAISTYRTLLNSKAHNLEIQYQQGMQGKPAFSQPSGEPGSGQIAVTAPNGKTYHFKDQQSAEAFKKQAGIQ